MSKRDLIGGNSFLQMKNGVIYYQNQSSTTFPDIVYQSALNSNYKSQIAHRSDASTAYEREFYTSVSPIRAHGTQVDTNGDIYSGFTVIHGINRIALPPVDQNVVNTLIGRIRGRAARDNGFFRSYVPLAEVRELRPLIKNVASSALTVVRGLVDLKNGNIKDAYSRASDLWLTFSFGVRPTISDIQDLSKAIEHRLSQQQPNAKYQASSENNYKLVHPMNDAAMLSASANVEWEIHSTINESLRMVAGRKIEVLSSNDYSALSQFGFPPENLIPAAWELVPYSWLIDYFLPIGDYLDDEFSSSGLNTIYCCLTRRVKCELHFPAFLVATSTVSVAGSASPGSASYRYINRTVYGGVPTRTLTFRSFDEDGVGKNAFTKLANLTALLAPRRGAGQ